MIDITEEYIKSTAFNDSSFSNGKKIARKGDIINPHITKDKTLIFGECMGSGKSNYVTSVDFMDSVAPVFRCSCPSRQIPCKHATGLLYSYYLTPEKFTEADVPEDVASKREKIVKRQQKKSTEEAKPAKVNVSAFIKKMKKQLEGIALVENFIQECLKTGIGALNITQCRNYRYEFVEELGNYYIPAYQTKISYMMDLLLGTALNTTACNEEKVQDAYKEVLRQFSKLYLLTKKGKEVLENYIAAKKTIDCDAADIFTKMGYVWKYEELKNLGFVKSDRHLLQLGFHSYDHKEGKAHIDVGYVIDIEDMAVYETKNIIPYKLENRLKAEDSVLTGMKVKEYVIYPGEMNKRIRFETYEAEPVTEENIEKVRQKAKKDFKAVIKEVKNQLKDPLADEHPVVLLKYKSLSNFVDEQGHLSYGIEDEKGETLVLDEIKGIAMPHALESIHYVLNKEDLEDQVLLGMFEYEEKNNRLVLQPISIITHTDIKRLLG